MKEMYEMNETILSILKKEKRQNKHGVIMYYATTAVLVTQVA